MIKTAEPRIGVPRQTIIVGDAATELTRLPDASVDMVVTSPPYFRLRNYDSRDQIGLEDTLDEWIAALRDVCRQISRILVPSGTLWLNLGDTYATHPRQGAPRKSLLMAPEQLALGLLADGWIIRNKIVWSKTNPMPSNAPDRLACTYEFVYVLARSPTYFFDLDSIRQPHTSKPSAAPRTPPRGIEAWRGPNGDDAAGLDAIKRQGRVGHPLGKNPGDVWRLATSSYRGAHHATFPPSLAERCIAAGCPEQRCTACRLPWRRRVIRQLGGTAVRTALSATCDCSAPSEPGIVLDPFIGSGSTAIAAERLGRDWVGIELNPEFAALARQRIDSEGHRSRAGPRRDAA